MMGKRTSRVTTAFAALAVFAGSAISQTVPPVGPVAPAAPKLAPVDRLGAQLAKAGIKRCTPIIRHVAKFLIENGDAAFSVKTLGTAPDTSPTMVSIESAHKQFGTTRYATLMVVPSESCSGYYEQSIYWTSDCAAVKQANFANFPATRPFLKNVQASAASPTVSLYLMPAGTGCVSMKKEVFR